MTVMATAGLFKMIYPDVKWVTRETVLSIHSSMISQHLISPSKRTENVSNAIAELADIGWFQFE